MTLQEFFAAHPKVALGFSGGVDSSYLLYAAKQAGADVRPYFAKTQFQPEFELEDAKRLAELVDIELTILPYDVLPAAGFNPPDRCYYCKTALFGALVARAKADGYDTIIDGTNASDDAGDRPGMKALQEMQVLSPLRLCGLTKQDIREKSKEAGLFTWDKPSYACLATRFPAQKSRAGGERAVRPGLYGFPGAGLPRRGTNPAAQGADGAGPCHAAGDPGQAPSAV